MCFLEHKTINLSVTASVLNKPNVLSVQHKISLMKCIQNIRKINFSYTFKLGILLLCLPARPRACVCARACACVDMCGCVCLGNYS